MKPIYFDSEAEAEVRHAKRTYEGKRRGLGIEFQEELEATVFRIRQNPLAFPVDDDYDARVCPMHRFPYTLYYLDLPEQIWVAAVAHQSRRPGYWFGRLNNSDN